LLPTSVPVARVSSGRENIFNKVIIYKGVILLTIKEFHSGIKMHEVQEKP
jgi:hypothetical protein